MNPGRLKDRITLQRKKEQEGSVIDLDDYEDYIPLWSEARFLKGRNFYAARAANVKTDVEFIIRYRTDIDETMGIKFNNRFYEIEGILPLDNNSMYLVVKAYEVKHDM
ncbi:phage head-tail adaptor, putative, SPP1 family [Tissierella praeacuta DSM 18095]|uniref:Phage head-tail adaptor, putative, SPP1 family n=1 Tax=Tissierella praeacuta DSM 18095 TaxID=1123404 RepID=A0A1M4Z6C6_9FIRM|nr:phage head closure protein [Tissierella praeacuta]TCU67502.1 SPP1 family predicted phage head-tail adaptor [Tissierella praeacuta]SHF13540.1 phage head-tail adaptor, putative, SPP1 family [Tissierella praeacuta DSM 18095]SUP00595.1 Bacteriophage head-tail adaptor [Tissierella praeacuta]